MCSFVVSLDFLPRDNSEVVPAVIRPCNSAKRDPNDFRCVSLIDLAKLNEQAEGFPEHVLHQFCFGNGQKIVDFCDNTACKRCEALLALVVPSPAFMPAFRPPACLDCYRQKQTELFGDAGRMAEEQAAKRLFFFFLVF